MTGWLESIVGPDYAAALMWTIVALIVLLVLLVLSRIARGFGVGTFVAGGRNRKARLAVMDATAVDSHRRLVLVRRDDVEHLILIGGPSDVVVEQNIRLMAPARRPAEEDAHPRPIAAPEAVVEQPRAQIQTPPPARPAAPRPAPAAPPPPPPAPAPFPSAVRPEPRAPQSAPVAAPPPPVAAPAIRAGGEPPRPPAASAPPVHAAAAVPRRNDIDDALLQELEVSLDNGPATRQPPAATLGDADSTLDDEMSRLLNDLAGKR